MTHQKTIGCPVCRKVNSAAAIFCSRCRYPLNVKKINELDKKDLFFCLQGLAEARQSLGKVSKIKQGEEKILNQLLNLHWLRPENALFMFLEARILLSLKKDYLQYPMLDLGCGDGLFTAILFGAEINEKYDYYEAVDFSKTDVFNASYHQPKDFFIKKPSKIGAGVDIKPEVVKTAQALKVYNQVEKGDVRKLPFADQSMSSVFCNMIDDVKEKDLSSVFQEVNRVLKPNGYFVFLTPTKHFRDFLFFFNKARQFKSKGDENGYQFFMQLDRGRSQWEPRPKNLWPGLFQQNGFRFVKDLDFADKCVLKFWDTGLRPFFYHLMAVRKKLRKNGLYLPAKKVFREIIKSYLMDFIKQSDVSQKRAFSIITAQKIWNRHLKTK